GAQGAKGVIGPSDVFTTNTAGGISVTSNTTLASLDLGAGKYFIEGRASFQGDQQIVRCNFSPAADSAQDGTFTLPGGGFQDEVNVHDTISLAAAGTLVLKCTKFGT